MNYTRDILQWYQSNKRSLPWRETLLPYPIWVSEVILQQTRVDQGLAYYFRFLENFPTVALLANATEQQVLSVWKGLGYYSRARNMHTTARMVVEQYDGNFPSTYNELISLKGIGPYTAAAISSICGNEAVPVVDGNVIRVFSRLFGIEYPVGTTQGYNAVYQKSLQYIDKKDPGSYNQAVMEFGALLCKPQQPMCEDCMFKKDCFALKYNRVNELPVPKIKLKKRERFFNYLIVKRDDCSLLMQQRTANDIWRNLWEFPLIEEEKLLLLKEVEQFLVHNSKILPNPKVSAKVMDSRHILTHQIIHARFFEVSISRNAKIPDYLHWQTNPLVSDLPVSRMIEKFLEKQSGHYFR